MKPMTTYNYIPNDGEHLTPIGAKIARFIDDIITSAVYFTRSLRYRKRIKHWQSSRNDLIRELHEMAIRLNKAEDEINSLRKKLNKINEDDE
jgi:hypothetical protein